ncbi:MAG: hypothetical protein ACRCS9_04940 [Hyphomicrobium sp.]
MASTYAWMISLTIGLCIIIISAGAGEPTVHMAAAGLVSLAFALVAIWENRSLKFAGRQKAHVAMSTARHTGLVWAWGALALLATYGFNLVRGWPEWWHFFLGFSLAAVGSLVIANMLGRDADANREDPAVMQLGRVLLILQLAGMVVAIVSLFIDGKFPRDVRHADWAGCNIFFFGALSIALISINALLSSESWSSRKA